jgi:ribosomal protein L37AE/L43A
MKKAVVITQDQLNKYGCIDCGSLEGHFFLTGDAGMWQCRNCTANVVVVKRHDSDISF